MPYNQYHTYTNLSQGNIYNQLTSYLGQISVHEGAMRINPLNANGDCNGWSFLFAYYNGINKPHQFKEIQSYISKWNGNIYSLYGQHGMSEALQKKYGNGIKLFEHTINDLSWFAHLKAKDVTNHKYTQDDRIQHFELVSDNKHTLTNVFAFLKKAGTDINAQELPDMLRIAHQWKNSWVDLGVYSSIGGHALAVYITAEGKYAYYDCNEYNGSFETESAEWVSHKILSSIGYDTQLKDFSLYQFHSNEKSVENEPNQASPEALDVSLYSMNKFINMSLQAQQFDPVHKILSLDDDNARTLVEIFGNSYLHKAVKHGHVELTQLLLEKSVDANAVENTADQTPLMVAAEIGNLKIASLLLQYGANINITNAAGYDAKAIASRHGQYDIVNLLTNDSDSASTPDTLSFSDLFSWDVANTIHKIANQFSREQPALSKATTLKIEDVLESKTIEIPGLESSPNIVSHSDVTPMNMMPVALQLNDTVNLVAHADIF
ncbi:ankyrin repeat domain-containing protein [Candidatus Berkiella aquae]|nr:ankyrin repeat domain-containing protein [Candidatus Berkiella aquae]MCS5710687.1 ankyrin repeat domain-containing protein [Candidatus Berkiella aquae]